MPAASRIITKDTIIRSDTYLTGDTIFTKNVHITGNNVWLRSADDITIHGDLLFSGKDANLFTRGNVTIHGNVLSRCKDALLTAEKSITIHGNITVRRVLWVWAGVTDILKINSEEECTAYLAQSKAKKTNEILMFFIDDASCFTNHILNSKIHNRNLFCPPEKFTGIRTVGGCLTVGGDMTSESIGEIVLVAGGCLSCTGGNIAYGQIAATTLIVDGNVLKLPAIANSAEHIFFCNNGRIAAFGNAGDAVIRSSTADLADNGIYSLNPSVHISYNKDGDMSFYMLESSENTPLREQSDRDISQSADYSRPAIIRAGII